MSQTIVLLGPQRLAKTLVDAVSAAGISGALATVTAGWEEREAEDQELREHLACEVHNLAIYRRSEELFAADPELFAELRKRHDTLRKLQEYYRIELAHALEAARVLALRKPDAGYERLLELVRQSAIEAVRLLDREHLERVRDVHAEFEARVRPGQREGLARLREAIGAELAGCSALCIAGGHVAILLNRLRLLDVLALHGQRPVFAWSAGAMVLGERIVLFHDSPPQGAGDAEVLELGLGIYAGIVPLPHARRRLALADPARVALFARRFHPDRCIALDEHALLASQGTGWRASEATRELTLAGAVGEVAA